MVRLDPEIEPLVRLLEDTPREKLLEEVAARIHDGLSLSRRAGRAAVGRRAQRAAAAASGLQVPRRAGRQLGAPGQPGLARRASLAADLLGARSFQGRAGPGQARKATGRCRPVDEVGRAFGRQGRAAFTEAMDHWDEPATDAAIAGLARSAGLNEIFEIMFRYGARDFRDIGHKAIFVANSMRTLNCIG